MIKSLVPPILGGFQKKTMEVVRRIFTKIPIYDSLVYNSIDNIPPIEGDVWCNKNWLDHVENTARQAIAGNCAPNVHILDLLTSSLFSIDIHAQSDLGVIDLGGGVGVYFPWVRKLANQVGVKLKYSVVDGGGNCTLGREIFKNDEGIKFFDGPDSIGNAIEYSGHKSVINISSTLQYIHDWKGYLAHIASYKFSVICISRFPSSDLANAPAFGIQNISSSFGYCGRTKVLLLSASQLVTEMKMLGYLCFSEKGEMGDASNYWAKGCSDPQYRQLTIKSFIFIKSPKLEIS